MKGQNIAERVLKTVKDEDLTHWIKEFLLNRETPPPNVYQFIPRDFPDPLDYFIVCLPYLEKDQIIKLGNKSLELLIQIDVEHILSDNSPRSEEERTLLKQLLLLLEVLPTSNSDAVISNLEKLRSNRKIIDFPDLHRGVLLTLANQFLNINSNTQEQKDWTKKLIEEMSNNPTVTMAAFAALSRISIDIAIYYFPFALKQLNEINLPIPNLCFDLTSQIGEKPNKWEQLATRLEYYNLEFSNNQSDNYIYDKAKNYLSRALDILEFQESLNIFETTCEDNLKTIQKLGDRLEKFEEKLKKALELRSQNSDNYQKKSKVLIELKNKLEDFLNKFLETYSTIIKELLINEQIAQDKFLEEFNECITKKLTVKLWYQIDEDELNPESISFSNWFLCQFYQVLKDNVEKMEVSELEKLALGQISNKKFDQMKVPEDEMEAILC